jgi:glycosyltransferase involved in cell wall biosynthesis
MLNLKGKNDIISIILPFKNEATYLRECVQSIIDQTYENWELILVDDHSSDASTDIAKSFESLDKRIKYYTNTGSGVIESLCHGFEQSTGSLITRMDGDDVKTSDNLEQLITVADTGVLGVGQVKYFREGGLGVGYEHYANWLNALCDNNTHFTEIYKECVIPSPCWLATRQDFIKAGGFASQEYPEDYDLCFRFYQTGLKTKGTKSVIHYWRDHDIRTTRTSDHYADNRFMAMKLRYFERIDYDAKKELVLWGAGKKGKHMARYFLDNNMSFIWITDNPKKIGHNIYGKILESSVGLNLSQNMQMVIAVADKTGQTEIVERLKGISASQFWFC